jgi:hypothetical protein
MDYKNRLKGAITQVLLKSLLEDAGYRIVPLGIEEVLRELSSLEQGRYQQLNLPPALRKLPDFFVADIEFEKTYLVEVKYRKYWNASTKRCLGRTLLQQLKYWNPLVLMLFIGNPVNPASYPPTPSHYMGVLWLDYDDEHEEIFWEDRKGTYSWDSVEWGNFKRVQDIFTGVSKQWSEQTLYKTMSLVSSLKDLDFFD